MSVSRGEERKFPRFVTTGTELSEADYTDTQRTPSEFIASCFAHVRQKEQSARKIGYNA